MQRKFYICSVGIPSGYEKKPGIFNAKIQLLFYKAVLKFSRTPFSRIFTIEGISQIDSFNLIPQQTGREKVIKEL